MTMEHNNTTSKDAKLKQKKSISKLLMPSKTPNKVGVEPVRSLSMRYKEKTLRFEYTDELEPPKSPLMVSKRPLSLDVQSLHSLQGANCAEEVSELQIYLMLTNIGILVTVKWTAETL